MDDVYDSTTGLERAGQTTDDRYRLFLARGEELRPGQVVILDRQVADSHPGRGEDRVAESGSHRRHTRFAHSARRSFAGDNIHKNLFGRLAQFGDVERIEIRLHGASLFEG